MPVMCSWRRLMLTGAVVAAAVTAISLEARQSAAIEPGYAPGQRVLLDAHNAYASNEIDRALGTGMPLAIEQDLVWYTDPATGESRSVVSHGGDEATSPTFESYFFLKVKPLMDRALAENQRADWPLITLNIDFKTNEPAHHAAVWALLGKYEAWLTTALRTATPDEPAPLVTGPMLVLTGSNDVQEVSFHDRVPVGGRLRLFGAIREARLPGANREAQARHYASVPVEALIPSAKTNYRRWVNFPWAVVEAGGQATAGDWSATDADRLRALTNRAHAADLWIRFYTLNGEDGTPAGGYNFGSAAAAVERWKAAIDAKVDFLATDQFERLARVRAERLGRR